jgi:hypothetical protein
MGKTNIGKKIKEVLDKSPLSVVEFAKRISITRDGAYKIFEKERINTALLQKISDVLEHDFFSYYTVATPNIKDNKGNYGYATKDELQNLTDTVQLLVKEIEKLRQGLSSSPKTKPAKRKK